MRPFNAVPKSVSGHSTRCNGPDGPRRSMQGMQWAGSRVGNGMRTRFRVKNTYRLQFSRAVRT